MAGIICPPPDGVILRPLSSARVNGWRTRLAREMFMVRIPTASIFSLDVGCRLQALSMQVVGCTM